MALVIVNPSPSPKRTKRKTATPARKKAAPKGAKPMAKHRSAAQKAATRRMLAANRSRKHRNPSPRKVTRRRAASVRRNPSFKAYRRRRNPSSGGSGGGSLLNELMSKAGMMAIAAVTVTPTVTELLVGYIAPSSTGYTRVAIKAAAGLGLAYAAHKFVDKRVGMTIGMVAAGTALAELVHAYQAGNVLATAASSTATLSGLVNQRGRLTMGGYVPTMKGYSKDPGLVTL